MSVSIPSATLEKFATFGDLLRFLRRRVSLTQTELAIAVGYGHTQISRLEQNLRLPDIPTIEARFVAALGLEDEPKAVARLLDLAANVRREDAPALGLCPYKGLNYFDEADADLFIGREALTARLLERILSLTSNPGENENRFLAIVGASGSGKSSLARAGLIPALRWTPATTDWEFHLFTPTAHPLEALADTLTLEAGDLTPPALLAEELARDPQGLHVFATKRMGAGNGARLVLVVDQFEEVFTLCRAEEERASFIGNLLTAASITDGPVVLILALRADFYAHCASYPELREALAQQQEYIGTMSTEELRRAVEEPAQRGRWEFEPGLVDLLMHDVGHEPGALPLLSHALLETWHRRRGRRMTMSGYASSGGVRGAIAETAETVFTDQFTHAQQAIARRIFLRLTELNDETSAADTRRRATIHELILRPEEADTTYTVLNTLAEARLITTGENTAEVAHEALIREWPTLRSWLEENREDLRLQRHLTEAAQEWLEQQRDPELLYRGARLAQARDWGNTHPEEMNALEQEFLAASIEFSEREAAGREAQRQRELDLQRQRAEEQTWTAKKLRRRALLLTGALVLAGVLAMAAFVSRGRAAREARLASSRELAAAAIANLDVDPERSILLALQSVAAEHTLEAEDALHKAVMASRVQLTLRGHTAEVWSVVFSPDGARIATASQDGTARVWDAASGQELLTLQADSLRGVNCVAFSPDGKHLATGGDDGSAKLWDAATGRELLTLGGHTDMVTGIAFSPDGKRLAAASGDKTVIVWEASTGRELLTLTGPTGLVVSVAFSPDGTRIAAGSVDGLIRIWEAATGRDLLTIPGVVLAFSPDGKRLAADAFGRDARIWDANTGQELLTLHGHTNIVNSVAFSPDGGRLVTSSLDRTAIVWDAATGRELLTLSGHTEEVMSAVFSPDGMRLATAGRDGTARVWSLEPGREVLTLFHPDGFMSWFALDPKGTRLVMLKDSETTPEIWQLSQANGTAGDPWSARRLFTLDGHTASVRGLAFSPDGSRVATGSDDGSVKIWDAGTGKELSTLTVHRGPIAWVTFSPDGFQLAATGWGEGDFFARLWDLKSGQVKLVLAGHSSGVVNAAYSPDGTRLVTGSDDESAKVWDTATGSELLNLSHPGIVYGVAFSPDGSRIATASNAQIIKVWDASSGKELLSFTGHTGSIVSIAFSPDGNRLATASRDGTAKIWDAGTGQELLTLYGSGVGQCCVAFSPDGTRLFVGGDEGVQVYMLPIDGLVRLARSRVTRSLTPEECQRYLHRQACPSEPLGDNGPSIQKTLSRERPLEPFFQSGDSRLSLRAFLEALHFHLLIYDGPWFSRILR